MKNGWLFSGAVVASLGTLLAVVAWVNEGSYRAANPGSELSATLLGVMLAVAVIGAGCSIGLWALWVAGQRADDDAGLPAGERPRR